MSDILLSSVTQFNGADDIARPISERLEDRFRFSVDNAVDSLIAVRDQIKHNSGEMVSI